MFGGCLLLAVVSATAGLHVSIPKPDYEVARGDNVTLPCKFEPANPDYPLVVVSWSTLPDPDEEKSTPVATFFNPPGKVDVTPAFEKRVTMKPDMDARTADLLITSVTLQENKEFECDVKIPGDDEGTTIASTRLVVLVAPSKPVCKIEGKAEYGQDIRVTCVSEEGSPKPQYTWTRYDVQNRPAAFPLKTTQKDGLLSLFNVSMETSGYYICTSANKIRSATCNMTLSVLPPSMNIGSTAGIIGGVAAALLVLGIIIYCCCRRKKKEESKEYAMGAVEEDADHEGHPLKKEGNYRDDGPNSPTDSMGDRAPRERIVSDDRYEVRSDRSSDRRDDYDERRERYDDRRDDYDERRDRYDPRDRDVDYRDRESDRRDRYPDRRDDYDDQHDRYDRRDRDDDRRDRDVDRRDRDGDRRDRESDRRDDYYDRRDD